MLTTVLIPTARYIDAPLEDTNLIGAFEQTAPVREQNDFYKVISGYETYERERLTSSKYRLAISIIPYFSNVLIASTGLDGYAGWTSEALDNEADQLSLLQENFGEYSYRLYNSQCETIVFSPTKAQIDFSKKWEYSIWYIDRMEDLTLAGKKLSNGLSVAKITKVIVQQKTMFEIKTNIPNKFTKGDLIKITQNNIDTTVLVEKVSSDYSFVVDSLGIDEDLFGTTNAYASKLIDGLVCEYKARYIKKIKNIDVIRKLGYATNFYKLNCAQTIDNGFELSGDTKSLIFRASKKQDGILWDNFIGGIDVEDTTDYNIKKINVLNPYLHFDISGDDVFYDIVEIEPSNTIKQLVVCEYLFNLKSRQLANYQESYRYKPYLEIALYDSNDVKTTFPFINDHHYIEDRMDLFCIRQDPCRLDINHREYISTCNEIDLLLPKDDFHDC